MKTSNVYGLLTAMQATLEKCNQLKEQELQKKIEAGILSDNDVEYIERKLMRIIKSLNGSRYAHVSKELKLIVEMIDMSDKSV